VKYWPKELKNYWEGRKEDNLLDLDIHLSRGSFSLEASLRLHEPITGVFGPSGSGKSTLLHVIAGLINPQVGKIKLGETLLYDTEKKINLPPHKRRIGYVFQDGQLFPHLSVKNNLLYGYCLVPRNQRRFKLDQIVNLLEIQSLLSRYPRNLSGGEKQRVALGRALLTSPRLLLLDEPLASLDEGLKGQILPFLKRIAMETHIPMIYVSHAIGEILQLTDQMVVIKSGRILGQGSFLKVMKDEKILDLAKLSGLENVMTVEVVGHARELGLTVAKLNHQILNLPFSSIPEGEKTFVSVRPEDIALAIQPVTGTSIQNQLEGEILGMTSVGNRILVEIDIGVVLLAELTIKAFHDLNLKEGMPVYCLIKTHAFTYLGKPLN
jgi:molybdate transport system ATP-binding protein